MWRKALKSNSCCIRSSWAPSIWWQQHLTRLALPHSNAQKSLDTRGWKSLRIDETAIFSHFELTGMWCEPVIDKSVLMTIVGGGLELMLYHKAHEKISFPRFNPSLNCNAVLNSLVDIQNPSRGIVASHFPACPNASDRNLTVICLSSRKYSMSICIWDYRGKV